MSEVRLIDANALKERLTPIKLYDGVYCKMITEKDIDDAPTVPLPDFKEGYKQAILDWPLIKQKSEWIPVSERLPEINKEVIVTDIETKDTYCSWYHGNGYWECDNGVLKNRVIAWQPLPEPYKKEINNEMPV